MNTVETYTQLIEETLNSLVPPQDKIEAPLYEAARYALLNGGKRIRPILTLAMAELFDHNPAQALIPACAIEMIHTYSLIHDDLPCMDNDDFRRGKPSLHKQYSESLAVLAGDFLLNKAFETIAETSQLPPPTQLELIRIIAEASGGKGMIGGQVIDILSEGHSLPLSQLQELHAKKTGALIVAAVECGCVVANASLQQREQAKKFAQNIGLAFQIVDDIIDITSYHAKRGSKTSSDVENNKSTYVTLLGLEGAQQAADQLFTSATKALEELPGEKTLLLQLAHFIVKRNY